MSASETRSFRWGRRSMPAAGFLTGLLLMLPGVFPVLAPVQVLAFVPLLIALRQVTQWWPCLCTGFLMGMGFVAPQILLLQLPPVISLILVVYFVALLMTLVAVFWRLIRPIGIGGALAFGALLALLDWATVTALPMWGTAQSFARCWSAYPRTIAFTSVTGMTAVMFLLGTIQSLAVTLVLDRRRRGACLLALLSVVALVLGVDLVVLRGRAVGHLKVAAVGWTLSGEEPGPGTADGFDRLYAEPVAEAARLGARLVVSPETAFAVSDDPDQVLFSRFLELAREHDVYLAVGYLDIRSNENRMALLGPEEGVMGRYTKTHLTPFEDNPKGDGTPTIVTIDGVSVGAMICHDDNYTDISRRYGSQATGVVVVPTNDWGPVCQAHFQSTIHRAIESRFAIVRAASNGISAIISPKGAVLDMRDHFREGPGLVLADVPIYNTRTVFSRFGHWFVPVCVILLTVHIVRRKRHE